MRNDFIRWVVLCLGALMMASFLPVQAQNDLPPEDFFQFPFPQGEAWNFVGTHGNTRTETKIYSAMDFSPMSASGEPTWDVDTSNFRVVAMANGVATKKSDCRVEVVHEGGWKTEYYHLESIPELNNTPVNANDFLGIIANTRSESLCEGGRTDGPHVHIDLYKNNEEFSLDGVTIGGWTVNAGVRDYDSDPETMWIYRGETRKYVEFDIVTNDPTFTSEFFIEPGDTQGLIEALHIASGNGLSDVIHLSPGSTYVLSGEPFYPSVLDDTYFQWIRNDAGQPITIKGNGATIERDAENSGPFRFFILQQGGKLILEDMTLRNGYADFGGAVTVFEDSELTLTNVNFFDNQAFDGAGGAVYVQGGNATIIGGEFNNNIAQFGGGVAFREVEQGSITAATFVNNLASEVGSAFHVSNGENTIAESCIVGNRGRTSVDASRGTVTASANWWGDASGPSGDYEGAGDKASEDAIVADFLGAAPEFCQDVVIAGPEIMQVTIADGDVEGLISAIESATTNGAALEITLAENGRYVFERAFERDYALPPIVDLVSGIDVTINGNNAVLLRSPDTSSRFRIALIRSGDALFRNVTFQNGYADFGGAVQNFEGQLILENVTMLDNVSTSSGGAVYSQDGIMTITDSRFGTNQASFGGAIAGNNSTLTLNNIWVYENIASASGGGITATSGGQLTMNFAHLEKNTADFGGAMLVDEVTTTITNGYFRDNSASQSADAIYVEDTTADISGSCFENHPVSLIRADGGRGVTLSGNWLGDFSGSASDQFVGDVDVTGAVNIKPDFCVDGLLQEITTDVVVSEPTPEAVVVQPEETAAPSVAAPSVAAPTDTAPSEAAPTAASVTAEASIVAISTIPAQVTAEAPDESAAEDTTLEATAIVNAIPTYPPFSNREIPALPFDLTQGLVLFPNALRTGVIEASSDTLFIFLAYAGEAVEVEMQRVDGDFVPYLEILDSPDSSSPYFAESANDLAGRFVRTTFTVPADGWYYILAGHDPADGDPGNGDFSLTLTGNTRDIYGLLGYGDMPALTEESRVWLHNTVLDSDVATYIVPLNEGDTFSFALPSEAALTLYDSGEMLAVGEGGALEHTAARTGWVRLEIENLPDDASGMEQESLASAFNGVLGDMVTATPMPTPTPTATPTPAPQDVEIGDVVRGRGDGTTAVRYALRANNGDVVTLRLESDDFDAYLSLEQAGLTLADDDNSGGEPSALIENFELNANPYIVIVSAADGSALTGSFVLTLEEGEKLVELPTCPGSLPSRLYPFDIAIVEPGTSSVRMRNGAGTNFAQVINVNSSSVFTVVSGPVCADGFAWYEIDFEGRVGWVAEGDGSKYWLERVYEHPSGFISELLMNGRGISTNTSVSYGKFQVEGYCSQKGYRAAVDERDWFCRNGNTNVETVGRRKLTEICQITYGRDDAYAESVTRGIDRPYRWRCLADRPIR